MDRLTLEQRIQVVKIHYRNGEKFSETVRKVHTAFGRNGAPSRTAIVKLIRKFERLGQVSDVKHIVRSRTCRSMENVAAVAESVEENPGLSVTKRSRLLGISKTTLRRILHEDLGMIANKLPSSDDLNPKNEVRERPFAIWVPGIQAKSTGGSAGERKDPEEDEAKVESMEEDDLTDNNEQDDEEDS